MFKVWILGSQYVSSVCNMYKVNMYYTLEFLQNHPIPSSLGVEHFPRMKGAWVQIPPGEEIVLFILWEFHYWQLQTVEGQVPISFK